jgi:hypothetical protein
VTGRELVLTVFGEDALEQRKDRVSFAAGGKVSVR